VKPDLLALSLQAVLRHLEAQDTNRSTLWLSDEEWAVLEAVVSVLWPCQQALAILQADVSVPSEREKFVSLGFGYPLLLRLKQKLSATHPVRLLASGQTSLERDIHPAARRLRMRIRRELEDHWLSLSGTVTLRTALLAALLDPRFKAMHFATGEVREHATVNA
jgi:hypothetical protein